MAVMTVEAPVAGDVDVEIVHWTCHCTDDMIAACKADLSDSVWNESDDSPDCPDCEAAWHPHGPCPWGCVCTECSDLFEDDEGQSGFKGSEVLISITDEIDLWP